MNSLLSSFSLPEEKNWIKFWKCTSLQTAPDSAHSKSYSGVGDSGFSSSSSIIFIACVEGICGFVFVVRCCSDGRSSSSSGRAKAEINNLRNTRIHLHVFLQAMILVEMKKRNYQY